MMESDDGEHHMVWLRGSSPGHSYPSARFPVRWCVRFTGQPVTYQIPANCHETKAVKPGFPREGGKSKKPMIADIYG